MSRLLSIALAAVTMLAFPATVLAADAPKVDTGDTSFVILSAALVLLMTPGLALFYGGMVRKKNVLSTIMHSLIIMGIISIQWVLFGYSLSFGPDHGSIIGGLNWLGLNGVGPDPNPDYAATIPAIVFMAFQLMFAIITPALISGSIAERMRFPAFLLFITKGKQLASFLSSSLSLAFMILTLAVGLFPNLLPATDPKLSLTIYNASSSPLTLKTMLIIVLLGLPFVLVYTIYAYRVFHGKVRTEHEGY